MILKAKDDVCKACGHEGICKYTDVYREVYGAVTQAITPLGDIYMDGFDLFDVDLKCRRFIPKAQQPRTTLEECIYDITRG